MKYLKQELVHRTPSILPTNIIHSPVAHTGGLGCYSALLCDLEQGP